MSQGFVRSPAVAGTFYPENPEALRRQIATFLAEPPISEASPPGRLKALIVPHAGYVYSGPIAAQAYRLLLPLRGQIKRVVLLGPAHRVYVPTVASSGASHFATPLGRVAVDEEFQGRAAPGLLVESRRAHQPEHSLEVQLPFLQEVLGPPAPKIVPLLVSDAEPERVATVLSSLWGGPETLVVISSDLSHFLPYAQARRFDADTAQRILSFRTDLDGEQACGCAAVNGLLRLASLRGLRSQLLDLRSSGDTAGGRDEVVGYAAFALYEAIASETPTS